MPTDKLTKQKVKEVKALLDTLIENIPKTRRVGVIYEMNELFLFLSFLERTAPE